MATLVLLRHGESEWNKENLFTGWVDVGLSPAGRDEATAAGELMAEAGLAPDVVHTSVLLRAIDTAHLALVAMGRAWLPVRRHWRLNERHYGALQGKNKRQTVAEHGEDQVALWRRSYDVPPPPLPADRVAAERADARYAGVPADQMPASECLADVVERMVPYWHDAIAADLAAGRVVLVVAHGNSIRALRKHLEGFGDDEIVGVEIPTGVPLVYEVDGNDPCRLLSGPNPLGDPEEVAARAAAVAAQTSTGG